MPICKDCGEREVSCKERCARCYNNYRRRNVQDRAPKIKCSCKPECQTIIPSIDQNGNTMRFAKFHTPTGENSKRLKYIKDHIDGYILEYCKGHPQADKTGYVLQHRLVYERYYNVCLLPWTEIHHKDRNRRNNLNISNLIPMSKSIHSTISGLERKGKKVDLDKIDKPKICIYPNCKNPNKTFINKKGSKCWFIWNNGYICRNCYYIQYRRNRFE